jgi:hypothetical protein
MPDPSQSCSSQLLHRLPNLNLGEEPGPPVLRAGRSVLNHRRACAAGWEYRNLGQVLWTLRCLPRLETGTATWWSS